MSESVFSRRLRHVSLLISLVVAVTACGGSGSSGTTETRTRNAALDVSPVVIASSKPASVSAGSFHSLVLDDTGRIYGFGSNGSGQYSAPALRNGSARFTAISGGSQHSLAFDDKGNLYAFGSNGYGQTSAPALRNGSTGFTAISAGTYHSLALDDKGNFYGFGSNTYGQATAPALRNGSTGFTAISAGTFHSLALDDAGNLYGFGSNGSGQTSAPPLRNGSARFTAIAGGAYHSLALDDAGNLYGFGSNTYGQATAPALRDGGSRFTAIAGGAYHSLALDDAGNLYGFGSNGYGQTTPPPSLSPVYLRTMPIAMNGTQAYGIDENGIVTDFVRGTTVAAEDALLSIAVGSRHVLAIGRSGGLNAWGDNSVGQLDWPGALGTVIQVVAGYSYSAALRADGSVVEWGAHTAPTGKLTAKPDDLPRIVTLFGASTHILGITESGTVVGWGNNASGQATPPEGLANVVAVAANARCSVALGSDGALTWWGDCHESFSRTIDLPDATAIALTDSTAIAIVNGSLRTWGGDMNGLSVVPEGDDFVALAAGDAAVLAVDEDGNVVTWGNNYYETITIPEMFGGAPAIVNDGLCGDCPPPGPITFTDEDLANDAAFYVGILPREQRDEFITALGGSPTKPLTPAEIQALVDAASATARAQALAEANAGRVDPATVPAATLPPAQSPATKVGTTISTRKAVTMLGLKRATKVTFVVPKKATASACTVTKTRVTAVAAGTCTVKVAYTDAKKKKRTTVLTLLIG